MGTLVPQGQGIWFEGHDAFTIDTGYNGTWRHAILRLASTGGPAGGGSGFWGSFVVPQNYVGTASIRMQWTSGSIGGIASAITGNAAFYFDYRVVSGDDTESLDQPPPGVGSALGDERVSITDAAPTVHYRKMEAVFSLTSANFAAGDFVEYRLSRDTNNDTLIDQGVFIANIFIHFISFQYADV
jgi:hypothetical protein